MQYKLKPRLPDFDYRGCYRYFITICTNGKQKLFSDGTRVKSVLEILAAESRKHGFTVWGYCFMPDHLHLLTEGERADSDMKTFVRVFKQKAGYAYGKAPTGSKSGLWQAGYYDHVLRKDEDLQGVLQYILNNPVRKGFVKHFADYPHSGSFAMDIRQITF